MQADLCSTQALRSVNVFFALGCCTVAGGIHRLLHPRTPQQLSSAMVSQTASCPGWSCLSPGSPGGADVLRLVLPVRQQAKVQAGFMIMWYAAWCSQPCDFGAFSWAGKEVPAPDAVHSLGREAPNGC